MIRTKVARQIRYLRNFKRLQFNTEYYWHKRGLDALKVSASIFEDHHNLFKKNFELQKKLWIYEDKFGKIND